MIKQNDLLNKLVEKATNAWSDIDVERNIKVNALKTVNERLATIATPSEENNIKIEIIRQTCQRLKERYPSYINEVNKIVEPFEHHLKFDNMAVLPFKQIDSLTYRIFMNQNMMSFVS